MGRFLVSCEVLPPPAAFKSRLEAGKLLAVRGGLAWEPNEPATPTSARM